MYKALSELINQNKHSYTIVETGCSAHGTKSTLWDIFVNTFGGKVLSVDLDQYAANLTNRLIHLNYNLMEKCRVRVL